MTPWWSADPIEVLVGRWPPYAWIAIPPIVSHVLDVAVRQRSEELAGGQKF
jgi:hypothetical protein